MANGSSVWLCIPSKRPPEEANQVLLLWHERGYKIALFCDSMQDAHYKIKDMYCGNLLYQGYTMASNHLVKVVLETDRSCEWVVLGGDDVEPDANHTADEIAHECALRFAKVNSSGYFGRKPSDTWKEASTFGVMQPTGDRYGEDVRSIAHYGADRAAYADRVCGSPWIGRSFAERINQGKGPLWPEYAHMFEDEELFEVATKYGVLWQRRDLIQVHNHWARPRGLTEDMPEFLKEVNSPAHWQKYKWLFEVRKAAGFPGSQPL